MTQPRLIAMTGLPGSGKSAVADGLSEALAAPVVSVDPIEAAMWASGLDPSQTGIAAYAVAQAVAAENLRLGHSVIIDAVNPVEAARDMWRSIARTHGARLTFIEVICSDTDLHRARVEQRVRNIPGMPEVTWADVENRRAEYAPWQTPRILLDTANNDQESLVLTALEQLS